MSAGETDITRRKVIVAGPAVASLAALGPSQALAVPFGGRAGERGLARIAGEWRAARPEFGTARNSPRHPS
jgi:hypothetical protein